MRHEEAHLGRREVLARALARAFREFPQQIFVGAAQKIRLHVGEAEAIARIGECLDDEPQLAGVHLPLAIALGGEVHHVDDAGEIRVLLDDGAHRLGQMLADIFWRPRPSAIGLCHAR